MVWDERFPFGHFTIFFYRRVFRAAAVYFFTRSPPIGLMVIPSYNILVASTAPTPTLTNKTSFL